MCKVLEWQDKKIIYRKYASLYFIAGVSGYENELSILEALHHFVESLDKYFGNVCELDLIYNFHKVSGRILSRISLESHSLTHSRC